MCTLLLLCTQHVNTLFILLSFDKKIMTLSFNGKYESILGPKLRLKHFSPDAWTDI